MKKKTAIPFTCRPIGFDKGLGQIVYRVFFMDGVEKIMPESEVNKLRTVL